SAQSARSRGCGGFTLIHREKRPLGPGGWRAGAGCTPRRKQRAPVGPLPTPASTGRAPSGSIVSTRGFFFKSLIVDALSSRIPLLFPRVAVGVVTVALPESQAVLVQQEEPEHPLHALPTIEMRHNEPQRAAMLRCERRAVMVKCEQHVRRLHVRQRHIGGVAL